jgi:DNA-binding response OmpR family regulator
MKKRILLVEDDPALAKIICDNLMIDDFDVRWTSDGDDALPACRAFVPDLVLLDVMLPGRNGFDLCRALRQGGRTPIIILSVRGEKADKLRGLELGADDYMTKPFDLQELVARIRVVLRRVGPPIESIRLGDVILNFQRLRARSRNGTLHLTHREFQVLRYLAQHGDQVVSRDELLHAVWGQLDSLTRPVDNAIARLRKKIEPDPKNPVYIHTVRGDGYSLTFEVVED